MWVFLIVRGRRSFVRAEPMCRVRLRTVHSSRRCFVGRLDAGTKELGSFVTLWSNWPKTLHCQILHGPSQLPQMWASVAPSCMSPVYHPDP